jgi:hypothetical protein
VKKTNRATQAIAAGTLLVAGIGAGVALGASGSASASGSTQGVEGAGPGQGTPPDPSKSMRSDEKLLTGTTASKVRAAALAKYPNATVQRVETDSDGVYEAHIVTSGGDQVIVQVGKNFTVTGTQTGGPGGGRGGHGGPGGDQDAPPTQSGYGA